MKTHLRIFVIAVLAILGAVGNALAQGPTIGSTLNGTTAKLGQVVEYTVSTTKGDAAENTMVKGYMTLLGGNVADQRANMELEYLETAVTPNEWRALPIAADGTVEFGPATGFPLTDAASSFRVKFSAVGTYNYKLEVRNGSTVVASSTEAVTVAFNEPTINSTLDNISQQGIIATGAEVLFRVYLEAKDRAGETVTTRLVLNNAADRSKFTLQYATNAAGTAFETLTVGEDGILVFGPAEGFALADMDQLFKVSFSEAGTYSYRVEVLRGADILGYSNETITVVEGNAAIFSTLNGRTVRKDIAQNFTVTLNQGAWGADTRYRVRLTLDNPVQKENFSVATTDGTPVNFNFDGNGVAYFGDAAGFALAENATVNLRAIATEFGTYGYKLELLRVVTDQDPQVIASSKESVTVAFANATIASNLNNRAGVKTTVVQDVNVTTVRNDVAAGTMVNVKLSLTDATQAEHVQLQYRTDEGTYAPLPMDVYGVAWFGPSTGFPLTDATSAIRATFYAAGTYGYKLEIIRVSDNEVLATANESVVVTAFQNALFSSSLDGKTGVKTGVDTNFMTSVEPNDNAGTIVRGKLTLANPADAANISLAYLTQPPFTYTALAFDENGVVYFGAAEGTDIGMAIYNFRARFSAAGVYNYNIALVTVGGTETVIASSDESVTVEAFRNATVATSLGEEVEKDAATTFTVVSTTGDVAGTTMVRGRLTLTDAAKAAHVKLEYLDSEGAYQTIAFTNGVALIGPAEGMALSQINGLGFRVTFDAAGTYAYTLELVNVDDGAIVASATESVEAIAPTNIKKGFENGGFAVYPTLTTGAVKVDLANARNASLQVIDMMGRAVVTKNNVNGVVELDLSKVAKGTYVVRIQEGNRINTQRVVVK